MIRSRTVYDYTIPKNITCNIYNYSYMCVQDLLTTYIPSISGYILGTAVSDSVYLAIRSVIPARRPWPVCLPRQHTYIFIHTYVYVCLLVHLYLLCMCVCACVHCTLWIFVGDCAAYTSRAHRSLAKGGRNAGGFSRSRCQVHGNFLPLTHTRISFYTLSISHSLIRWFARSLAHAYESELSTFLEDVRRGIKNTYMRTFVRTVLRGAADDRSTFI